ncbi:hypothetical protein IAU59_003025 [Kwoniella sp. CBS 9459]
MAKPSSSATRIVQNLLSKHEHLSTQQMFQMSTENMRPILQPAHMIDKDGRIRMKKVSNMREGRRPWVPMPTAPFPDHPFKSVSFLKRTILTSLESQGLIHKARIERPIETDQERQEAIQQAMKLTRKAERTALRLKEPVPPPRQPKTTVTEFAWKMGPRPELTETEKKQRVADEEDEEMDFDEDLEAERADRERSMRLYAASLGKSTDAARAGGGAGSSADEWALRWDQAARLEESFHRAKEIEAEQIAQRRAARREAFKLEREQKKAERADDEASGRMEAIRAERKRIEALEAIEKYAQQTGEDVSGWYEELGIGQGETIPLSEEKEKRIRRKSGFGLR